RRNIDRFSEEMIFQLTDEECELLVSQNAIPSKSYFGGHLPHGFTQLGANKVAFYLKSEIADMRATQILKAFLHFENLHRKGELGKVDPLLIEQTASEAKSQGVQIGFTISRVAAKHDVPVEIIFMILKFRKNGLTQQQAAYAFGLKYWHIQDIEKSLRKVGIEIPPIRKNKVDKDIMDDMDAILFGSNMTTPEKGGIRYE
ncbi:MAG: ORF6N domain-containing protein, partial [Thermodesulfobacteriota bacterium]|nr:ORF6N domain-containing protein [Thermodesulfobacteriota bacterium]